MLASLGIHAKPVIIVILDEAKATNVVFRAVYIFMNPHWTSVILMTLIFGTTYQWCQFITHVQLSVLTVGLKQQTQFCTVCHAHVLPSSSAYHRISMESPGNVAMLRCRKCRKSYIDSTCLYPVGDCFPNSESYLASWSCIASPALDLYLLQHCVVLAYTSLRIALFIGTIKCDLQEKRHRIRVG